MSYRDPKTIVQSTGKYYAQLSESLSRTAANVSQTIAAEAKERRESAITGRGADLLIIDDPHTEQDSLSDTAMERAYEWYSSGPRQRLQPGGRILVVMTR